jgi:GTP-binding protein HflX
MIMVFNKIDKYTFVKKDEIDLTPSTKENISLEQLQKTWMSQDHHATIFVSATQKIHLAEFKKLIYDEVKTMHAKIYPYNNFLY